MTLKMYSLMHTTRTFLRTACHSCVTLGCQDRRKSESSSPIRFSIMNFYNKPESVFKSILRDITIHKLIVK